MTATEEEITETVTVSLSRRSNSEMERSPGLTQVGGRRGENEVELQQNINLSSIYESRIECQSNKAAPAAKLNTDSLFGYGLSDRRDSELSQGMATAKNSLKDSIAS